MLGTKFHLDTRIRRRHVPLITQQHRLHHLHCVASRNLLLPTKGTNSQSKKALYFTLQDNSASPAYYRSESIYDSPNPSWKSFEVSNFPDHINKASCFVIVKVWCEDGEGNKVCLTEWMVYFSGLVYLGEQIEKGGEKFKPNTLVFGMLEGYYESKDCYWHPVPDTEKGSEISMDASTVHKSYGLNTLRRIRVSEKAIVQMQAADQRKKEEMERRLQSTGIRKYQKSVAELQRLRLSILHRQLRIQQKRLGLLQNQRKQVEKEVEEKRVGLIESLWELDKDKERFEEIKNRCSELPEDLLQVNAEMLLLQKRLIFELSEIFSLEPRSDGKGFLICGVHLPDSEYFTGEDEERLSVGVGYVCRLVAMISSFLNVPLRYPVTYFGSQSTITDLINEEIRDNDREVPLYSKGVKRAHFKYGVYLLNKNIAQIRKYFELTTKDLPATLPNLHHLMEWMISVQSKPSVCVYPSLSRSFSRSESMDESYYKILNDLMFDENVQ